MISKCVLRLATNLSDSAAPENAVLGSCAVLSSQTVLKHLTVVSKVIIENYLMRFPKVDIADI